MQRLVFGLSGNSIRRLGVNIWIGIAMACGGALGVLEVYDKGGMGVRR